MEVLLIIGFIYLVFGGLSHLFSNKRTNTESKGSPNISFSQHPNAGLIAFLDPEDCYNQGILPNKKVSDCGCVTYSDDRGAWATDCCAKCSEENSPF